jgi:hypothetical protein
MSGLQLVVFCIGVTGALALCLVVAPVGLYAMWKAQFRGVIKRGDARELAHFRIQSTDLDSADRRWRRWALGAGLAWAAWGGIRGIVSAVHAVQDGMIGYAQVLGPKGMSMFDTQPPAQAGCVLFAIDLSISAIILLCGLLATLKKPLGVFSGTMVNFAVIWYTFGFSMMAGHELVVGLLGIVAPTIMFGVGFVASRKRAFRTVCEEFHNCERTDSSCTTEKR